MECKHCDKKAEWKWISKDGLESAFLCERCMDTVTDYMDTPLRQFEIVPEETIAQLCLEIRNLAHRGWEDRQNAEFLFREIGKRAQRVAELAAIKNDQST